jgi:acyl carrier protein
VDSPLREALAVLIAESYGLTRDEFDNSTALFSSRLLDSFALVELIAFIEQREGIKFKAASFRLDNFDTIERMIELVKAVKAGRKSA